MNTLLKTGQIYGSKVGHKTVFTKQAAIERYKAFLEVCYNDLTIESAIVLNDVEQDMILVGFSAEELQQIEKDYLKN